jgi:septal ring factor EnvC (AmiA/AmiB activator)
MRIVSLIFALPLLAAASAPVQPVGPTLGQQLQQAKAERAAAESAAAKLQQEAARAQNGLDRLRAEQAASAQAIEAAEARITAADIRLRLASAYVASHREQLEREQQPISSLLAGLAVMGRRPPLLAIADEGSTDELVRVRILLAATIPAIRERTSKLSAQLSDGKRLEQAAAAARAELIGSRQNLIERRQQFASLEQKAQELAAKSSSQALSAGDVALAAGENVESLVGSEAGRRTSAAVASGLAADDPAPARPAAFGGRIAAPPFAYDLPAARDVTEGLASVNQSGVQSRGITLATVRGAEVTAPASGTIRFSGPFRDYDGVLIIDHGGGWLSLIVNVASTLRPGERVVIGQIVGRALGPLQVELSQNGRRISPALIAGSSQSLSKGPKGG